jgi:hypothetical protein
MKKRTVITTETREIWIVRQPAGNWPEDESDVTGSNAPINSLALLEEEHPQQTNPRREEFKDDSDNIAE